VEVPLVDGDSEWAGALDRAAGLGSEVYWHLIGTCSAYTVAPSDWHRRAAGGPGGEIGPGRAGFPLDATAAA
jgi:hypothetical protein